MNVWKNLNQPNAYLWKKCLWAFLDELLSSSPSPTFLLDSDKDFYQAFPKHDILLFQPPSRLSHYFQLNAVSCSLLSCHGMLNTNLSQCWRDLQILRCYCGVLCDLLDYYTSCSWSVFVGRPLLDRVNSSVECFPFDGGPQTLFQPGRASTEMSFDQDMANLALFRPDIKIHFCQSNHKWITLSTGINRA